MNVSSAVPEHLFRFAADVLPQEQTLAHAASQLEERLTEFQTRCPEFGFCPTPRGYDLARHAQRGATLAEWVSAVGAAFLAADDGPIPPGTVRTVPDADLAAYLEAVGAFPLLEQREGYDAGVAYAAQIEAAIAARDAEAAEGLLRGVADYVDNEAFLRGFFLALGPLDQIADRIDAIRDRGNFIERFLAGARDSIVNTASILWGLSGQIVYDPSGWADNWGSLGNAAIWAVRNPDDFGLAVIDWEGLKEDPARWLGGLAPDALAAIATAGVGAAVGRGGSATRGALRGASRSLKTAKNLQEIVAALRPIAGATLVDVGSRARTIGGRQVRWTPVGFVDETGSVARAYVGTSRGPLSRMTRVAGHDPTTTFRSGQYLVRRTTEPMTLYRVGNPGRPLGNYWTAIEPRGPGQSQIDSALQPSWGNTAQEVTEIHVPPGTTIYEGIAGPQPVFPQGSAAPTRSGLVGGGHQVFIPDVPEGWIVKSRSFFAASFP